MFCGTRKHHYIFYFFRFRIKCDRPIICYSPTSHSNFFLMTFDHYTNSIAIWHEVVLVWGRRVRYGIVLHLRLQRLELCTTPETFTGCKYWSIFSHHYELTWTSRLGKKSTTTSHLCWKDIAHWVAEIWVLVDSLVFCVGAVVPQRFITVPVDLPFVSYLQ